jgi:hypothetical protein
MNVTGLRLLQRAKTIKDFLSLVACELWQLCEDFGFAHRRKS